MSHEWVAIAADETEEPVEVATEEDGSINLASVTAQFPGATGLKYRHPETNKLRGVRIQGDLLLPPSDEGWGPYTYLCVRQRTDSPKKDEAGLKRKTDNDGEMYSKNIRYDESDEDEQPLDLIVLGLPYKTTQEEIRDFFSQFGEVDLVMLKTKPTGESRGFAFIRFADKAVEKKVVMQKHLIDGRWCDIKVPDSHESKKGGSVEEIRSASKIFVGKITEDLTTEDLKAHFENFGEVRDVYIPTPFRHFAFVQFSDVKTAKSLRGKEHDIKGVKVRIGQAVPKSEGNKSQEYRYPPGPAFGTGPEYTGQSGFGSAFANSGNPGGRFNPGGGGGGYNSGPPFGGAGGNSGGGFGPMNRGGFGGGGAGGFSGGPSGFGGGGFGGGGGPGSGYGGFGASPNVPSGINFADIARLAIEMGFGGANGGGGGGGNWSQGPHRGGDHSRNQMSKFSETCCLNTPPQIASCSG